MDAESIVPGMLVIKYFLRPFEQPSNEQAESVQEDDVAARHCDQIPVASKFGGAAAVIQRVTRSWTLLPDLEKLDPIDATELPACQHWSIKVTLLKFVPLPGFLLQLQLELVCKTSRHSAGLELLLHQVFLHASLQQKGAGRTTMFGRKIWCAAMLGTGSAVQEALGKEPAFVVSFEESRWTFMLDLETRRLCLLTACIGDRAVPQTVAW